MYIVFSRETSLQQLSLWFFAQKLARDPKELLGGRVKDTS
jgi:hypothetical protein